MSNVRVQVFGSSSLRQQGALLVRSVVCAGEVVRSRSDEMATQCGFAMHARSTHAPGASIATNSAAATTRGHASGYDRSPVALDDSPGAARTATASASWKVGPVGEARVALEPLATR